MNFSNEYFLKDIEINNEDSDGRTIFDLLVIKNKPKTFFKLLRMSLES
jgi:hypothetical protein